jgi:predicted amidophosphoribosyltransferase
MMILTWGKIHCQSCGHMVTRRAIRRSPRDRRFGICNHCLKQWEVKGKICVVCEHPVKGIQALAFSSESKGFTHVDCGGLPLA